MSLRTTAANDFKKITQNLKEWGLKLTITAPDDSTFDVIGLATDISLKVDPDTGLVVSGRKASVAISLDQFRANDITEVPSMRPDQSGKPYRISFTSEDGNTYNFSIRESIPDRTLDQVVLILQQWRGAMP